MAEHLGVQLVEKLAEKMGGKKAAWKVERMDTKKVVQLD